MSRPSKFTTERVEAILADLRIGCTRTAASECNGIDRTTFTLWLERYPSFSSQVHEAESFAEQAMTAAISKAAQSGDWRASLEWLKRRRPEDWSEVQKQEISGPNGRPVVREINVILQERGDV